MPNGVIITSSWQNSEPMDKDRVIKTLSGCANFPTNIKSEVEMLGLLTQGLPFEALRIMEEKGVVDDTELKEFIAPRTLARRKKSKRLSPEESHLVARLARIYDYALEVFGSAEKVRKWFRTPNLALDGQHPLELLKTDYGARMVEAILGRIDHGIYS
jgi:putative toxin-antitoxin system antitoxin component (TIGR02293 family)